MGATVDTVLSVIVLTLIWFPAVSLMNSLAGRPFGGDLVFRVVVVLAVGTAYPFVAGDWSLGDLGEYLFLLFVAALAWGLVVMGVLVILGIELFSPNPLPQATVWFLAYGSTYYVVFRTDTVLFR